MTHEIRILFICMGNICRSPTAEGVFRHQVQRTLDAAAASRIVIDSAGTHNYHPGEPPDARSQAHALRRGYDLSALRARALTDADIERFDRLIVMDDANYVAVKQRADAAHHHKIRRLTEFCVSDDGKRFREVPDPYYGEAADFERVLDLVEDGCQGLCGHIAASFE
jgi:protein-tyrosine phosphatase